MKLNKITALINKRAFARQKHHITHGYLLPVVMSLGLAISLVSILALKQIATNSLLANQETYKQFADDAARAGISAALACVKAQGGATWTSPLVPNSDCTGSTNGSTKSAYVNNDTTNKITTSYSVAVPASPTNGVTIITSTGNVTTSGISAQTRTLRSLVQGASVADQVIATVPAGTFPMNVIASPDGSKIYVANQNSSNISVINTSNNTVAATIALAAGTKPRGFGISSDSTRLYASDFSSNGRLTTINAISNTIANTANLGSTRYPIGVVVTPDNSKALTINNYGSDVSILNTSTFTVANPGTGYQNGDIVVMPDNSRAFVSVYGNTAQGDKVHVINLTNNSIIAKVNVGSVPGDMVLSPDASTLYVANQSGGTVSAINTSTYAVSTITLFGASPIKMVLTPDGKKLYVTNSNCSCVNVIDTVTKTNTTNISTGGMAFDITVTPDGSKVYVANQSLNTVSVIKTSSDTVTKTISVGTTPFYMAITPDGSKLYVANSGTNNVSVINTGSSSSGINGRSF